MEKFFSWLKNGGFTKSCVVAGIAAMCIAAVFIAYGTGVREVSGEKRDLPIYNVKRDDKLVSISFDAAWGDEQTQSLLETMENYGVKTTFFVVGEWVDKYPETVKLIHDAGHEVMNHSDSHPEMTKLSAYNMGLELEKCNDKIEAVTGVRPTLFRPPYGDYNNAVVGAARDAGMFTIQWNIDSLDWKNLTPEQMMNRIMPKLSPGSIILLHNGGKHTPELLPVLLEALQSEGYTVVPISEIIYKDNFEIEPDGRQVRKQSLGG
ncbi:MAG: polysaccharide deacetylase family protein [Clostridia bacterium]|nr:polysaccharide deacetylase family protein [Clostridia bacterium]